TPPDADTVALRLADGTDLPVQEIVGPRGDVLHVAVRPAADLAAGLRKGSLGLTFLGRQVQRVASGKDAPGEDRTLAVTVGPGGPGLTAEDKALAERVEAAGGDWTIRVVEEPRRAVYAAVPVPPL